VIYPVVLDSTLFGYPPLGSEPTLLLARRGDTLQTAAVARWDSLLTRITRGTDTSKQHVIGIDTASVAVQISDVPLHASDVTFDVYDVDTTAADPDTGVVRALFRPDRLLGSRTVPKDSVTGVVRVPIAKEFLLARVLGRQRVRLGIAVRSDSSVLVRILSSEGGTAPSLTYLAHAAADTQTLTLSAFTVAPPRGTPELTRLTDYSVVLVQPPGRPGLLAVGGLPGRRAYLRFDLPARIVDSTTVVRASLVLTQAPAPGFASKDSLRVIPRIVLANKLLDPEPGKAALVLAPVGVGAQPVALSVADSGAKRIEIANVVARWRLAGDTTLTRALVLQAPDEGSTAETVYFYSSEAPLALRPRLEMSYVPRGGVGLP
jgi:hypothetical protein